MPATAAARRVAASPARRATASRAALKPRPKAAPRSRAAQPKRKTAAPARRTRTPGPARRGARSQATPITGFVPLAVGCTAGAVGGLADSFLVVRLTRGRLWIGLLAALLVGIVALNVGALSINAGSSRIAEQTDGLRRANSALQARIAGQLTNQEVQAMASSLGLVFPDGPAIRTVNPSPGDAATAAQRLANGELTIGSVPPPTPPPAFEEAVVPAPPLEGGSVAVTETPPAPEVP